MQRYPEVLDYYYALVGWTVRGDYTPGGAGAPMVSPRCDAHGEGYFTVGSRSMHIPHNHGPLPPPTGGLDAKQPPGGPFYGRNNSYGSLYSTSSSGYASGSGSLSPLSSSPSTVEASQQLPPAPHFQTYAYGRPGFRP